ncbi:hypothetical protein J6590_059970 [Homalodisca vitripennis]|nr:hypothetical protein J6590_059970 [Homalodisca vitripennis]
MESSKNNFVGLQTLKLGTYDAVITFNEGNQGRLAVLKGLGVKIGKNCANCLSEIVRDRMIKLDIACEEKTKLARKRTRMIRKKLLDAEKEKGQNYEAGMFLNEVKRRGEDLDNLVGRGEVAAPLIASPLRGLAFRKLT